MKVLITGCGRSCTNWVTEIVRSSGKFNFTKSVEDRQFFHHKNLPEKYGTKLATENIGFNWNNIDKIMLKYQDLKVIFAVRHPISNAMSKVVRGQPSSKGGDASNLLAPDATIDGASKAIRHMFNLYTAISNKYRERVLFIRLEDLIYDVEKESRHICTFLEIEFDEKMLSAHKFNRNRYQKQRYGDKIDKNQAEIYSNWKTVYNGFFEGRKNDIEKLKNILYGVIEGFGYEI